MIDSLVARDGTAIRQVATPVRFGDSIAPTRYPPQLGQHSREVLRDVLKMDATAVQRLVDAGVLGEPEP